MDKYVLFKEKNHVYIIHNESPKFTGEYICLKLNETCYTDKFMVYIKKEYPEINMAYVFGIIKFNEDSSNSRNYPLVCDEMRNCIAWYFDQLDEIIFRSLINSN